MTNVRGQKPEMKQVILFSSSYMREIIRDFLEEDKVGWRDYSGVFASAPHYSLCIVLSCRLMGLV